MLLRHQPRIAKSVFKSLAELKEAKAEPLAEVSEACRARVRRSAQPLYNVVSVELGNTTTKCIVTSTNLRLGQTYLVSKEARLTRTVRKPRPGEKVFGKTIWGVELTEGSVAKLVRDTLLAAVGSAKADLKNDVHFVVRSTGVTSALATPEEVDVMIKALAKGCMLAGVPPGKMVAALTKSALPDSVREFSNLDKVPFIGAVTGVIPPRSRGLIMGNEMEAELSTAGIKVAAKWVGVDYRHPLVSFDFGTTLKGRAVNDKLPYADTVGSITGLGGAIFDAMSRATGFESALELYEKSPPTYKHVNWHVAEKDAEEAMGLIKVVEVPEKAARFGTVPVNPKLAKESNVVLVGVDVGDNGSDLPKLSEFGDRAYGGRGLDHLAAVMDCLAGKIVFNVLSIFRERGILNEKFSIGVTGRAGVTGFKPHCIMRSVKRIGLIKGKLEERVVFAEDGLAMGAAVMARCMHNLGTPQTPLGGNRGMSCILNLRIKYHGRKFSG